MSPSAPRPVIAVASTGRTCPAARLSVRFALDRAGGDVTVVDLDGRYRPVASETVVGPTDLGATTREVDLAIAAYGDRTAAADLLARLVGQVQGTQPVVAIEPGLLLLGPVELALGCLTVVTRSPMQAAAGRPALSTSMVGLHDPPPWVADGWREAVLHGGVDDWLDPVAALLPRTVVLPRTAVISPWSLGPQDDVRGTVDDLRVAGHPVVALDLSRLDPHRPWLLGPAAEGSTALSQHPALARVVETLAAALRSDGACQPAARGEETSLGVPVDEPIRHLVRRALEAEEPVPEPFEASGRGAFLEWLTSPGDDGVPRYLAGIWATRPDLRATFPRVPGPDAGPLLAWASRHGSTDGYADVVLRAFPAEVPTPARPSGRPEHGVTVAGFLGGGMGLSESARLLVAALDAVGISHAEHAVRGYVAARAGTTDLPPARPLDTTVLCVNADLAPAVASGLPPDVARAYRVGMWYWEVEDFPPSQHGGFDAVDEVWVATDFVHRAVARHSPVPVRTLMPPLPQRTGEPSLRREDLGLPDRPYFLFAFDFLSTAERKNPWGLVDAFRQAFQPGEGPLLVIKSINASERPSDAERLRLAAAEHPDVVLLERYMSGPERDALVAHCLAYVSLHRSEGLGLTMAEAMAWGKPVVATGYSGNLAFMTEANSYLVPWSPTPIPADAAPYPPGTTWADPDLAAAAAILRHIVAEPQEAAARGAIAARDIATRHTPEAAGRAFAARLAELAPARRAKARREKLARVRRVARAIRDELRSA